MYIALYIRWQMHIDRDGQTVSLVGFKVRLPPPANVEQRSQIQVDQHQKRKKYCSRKILSLWFNLMKKWTGSEAYYYLRIGAWTATAENRTPCPPCQLLWHDPRSVNFDPRSTLPKSKHYCSVSYFSFSFLSSPPKSHTKISLHKIFLNLTMPHLFTIK